MSSDISSDAAPGPRRVPSLGVLIAISTISPMAMNIYLPSMAGMQDVFSATAGEIQLTMSVYFVAVALAQLVLGPLSDQYGRRPVILLGMALFVAGSIMCLLAPTIEALIAARAIQAVGGCSGLVLGRAIVRDVYGREQAASMIGYVTMGMTVAPTLGPAVGGLLDQQYGWQGGFFVMLVFGIGVWVASVVNLPETHLRRSRVGPAQVLRSYGLLAREKEFWAFALSTALTSSVYFAYLGGAPFIAVELLNMPPAQMGFYFMFVALGYILGNFLSGRFAERIGLFPMILGGTLIAILGVAVLAVAAIYGHLTPVSLFLPMFLLGLGNGVCLPSAISGAVSVRPDHAGAASGLTASMQVGFGAITSTTVAWMFSGSALAGSVWAMISVMAVGIGAGLIAVLAIPAFETRTED